MTKKMLCGVGLALLASGCVGDAVSHDVRDDARAGEAREALIARASVNLLPLTPEEKEEWRLGQLIPRWKVFMQGKGDPDGGGKALYADPRTVDHDGALVLAREKDMERPERWFVLSLEQSWMRGDAYFAELMATHHLTPADLIGILQALEEARGAPPSLPASVPIVGQAFEVAPGSGPPLGDPTDDHRGGPPPSGRANPPGPGASPPLSGGRFDPHNRWSWPTYGSSPEDPKWQEQRREYWEWRNGVRRDDEAPREWTPDESYVPPSWERKEVFKCEGIVYDGYKGGCIDFQEKPIPVKWETKLVSFMWRGSDAFHDFIYHNLWNDGKNPECTVTCERFSNLTCAGFISALVAVCVGSGGGCLAVKAAAVATLGGSTFVFAECTDEIRRYCHTNICIH